MKSEHDTPITDKFKAFMHGVDGDKYWVPLDCSRSIERIGRRAFRKLDIIAEDCDGWLNNQCDETACEFIKKVRDYAKEASK